MNPIKKTLFAEKLVDFYLCLILFLLPLTFNDGFYNISQAKSLCFLILSIPFIFIYAVYIIGRFIIDKKINLRFNFLDLAMILFAFINVISSAFSKYGNDVWLGKNSRLQGGLIIVIYVVIYFMISHNLNLRKVFPPFLVLSFCIVSFIAIMNSFNIDLFGFTNGLTDFDKERFISTIGNINFFGAYVCLCFPFIIVMYCTKKNKIKNNHYLLAMILGSFSMVLTSSESFVIGFFAFLAIFPFFCFKDSINLINFLKAIIIIFSTAAIFSYILRYAKTSNYMISDLLRMVLNPVVVCAILLLCMGVMLLIRKKQQLVPYIKKTYITALVSGFIIMVFMFFYANYKSLGTLDKYFKITETWGTNRGFIYKRCFEIIDDFSLKDWLIGLGPETLQNVFEQSGGGYVDQAHSEYLQFLLTLGIAGLMFYLSIIVSVTVMIIKKLKTDWIAIALFMGLLAYWTQAMFNIAQSFTTPFVYVFISIISGIYKKQKEVVDYGNKH